MRCSKSALIYPSLPPLLLPNYLNLPPNLPDKGEVIVETVEGGGHKVESEHLLVLEDALAQGDGGLVLHVDGAAQHELQGLSDEDDCDCVVRVIAPPVPTGCNKHTLEVTQVRIWLKSAKIG